MILSVRLKTLSMFPTTATARSKLRPVLLLMNPLLRAEFTSSTGCGFRLAVGQMPGGRQPLPFFPTRPDNWSSTRAGEAASDNMCLPQGEFKQANYNP